MIQGYEYIRISSDLGDLNELCRLAVYGWKVIFIDKEYLLLERPLTEEQRQTSIRHYTSSPIKRP